MAFQFKITTSNALLDQFDTLFPAGAILEVYSGTPPTDADTAIGAQTLLAAIILPSSPWAAAATRSKAKQNTWQDASADGGSATAPTFCRLKNAADTHRIDMTAGVGSGDAQFDGAITAGQTVTITTFAVTGPS